MKKTVLLLATGMLGATGVWAAPLTVCDFESYSIGDVVPMWCPYGDVTSTAVVEADPSDPGNKVLHVTLDNWNTFVQLAVPGDMAGRELTTLYPLVELDVYRAPGDPNDWKQFRIFLGDEEIMDVDGYPHQGDKAKWQHRSYTVKQASGDNSSKMLRLGMHSDASDYYIDNVVLKGLYDDYAEVEGGVLDLCRKNTSSDYVTYGGKLAIYSPLSVYTSRYTEFKPDAVGDGPLSLYCGGERTYLGEQSGSMYPDWTPYTGDIHIYPWRQVETGAGFYGLVLNHGGKKFNPEDIAGSLPSTNSRLLNNTVTVHDGATLATPTGIRGVRIGALSLEEGSRLFGSIKASTSNAGYFVVGASGTDELLAGRIAPAEKGGSPDPTTLLGLIKEGAGTYRITGNDNLISGAIRILDGKVLADNDADAARLGHRQGATGNPAVAAYVFTDGTIGGSGSIGGTVDLYGTIEPGSDGVGTLTLADFADSREVALRLRPTSKLRFEIRSAQEYDRLDISGAAEYYNIGEDFLTSDKTPVLYLLPTPDNQIQAGDRFELITAASKSALNDIDWSMRVQYPDSYTWRVTEIEGADGFSIVAEVVSLDYSGQGDTIINDSNGDSDVADADYDFSPDRTDSQPLRYYAEQIGKEVGVAVSPWRFNIDDNSLKEVKDIAREFNVVVAENEMKFEVTQPSRGTYSYGDADRVVAFAERHGMAVRGHTFAWHTQCPTWLSSDGGKKNNNNYSRDELLEILRDHINHVAGRYKNSVREWDVANEILDDDQSVIRTDPDGYTLRPSIWSTGIGEDFIDSVFVYVHRAAPNALLYLNDYGVEFQGKAKTEAFINLAKRLKDSGIPIHGVGLQCHFRVGEANAAALASTIERFAALGLECVISELDLGTKAPSDQVWIDQAREYYDIARVMATHDNCKTLMVWGYSDDHSWRTGEHPLLFDESHNRKEAYYGVHAALRQTLENGSGIDDINSDEASETGRVWYNLQGVRLQHPAAGAVVIEVTTYSDGSRKAAKRRF